MFNKVKPSVLNLLHTIFGVKMTSAWDPLPSVLPGLDEHIKPYTQRLAAMAMMEGGGGLSLLKKWRVKRICVYKSMSSSRHEYITAAVTMGDSESNLSYVVIERNVGDPIRDLTNIDPVPPGPLFSSSNSSFSSIPSLSDSANPAANDKIGPIDPPGKREETDQRIYALEFDSGKQLYLYELAVLALIVHEENVCYLLMSNNCYHYAGTIVKVLEHEYGLANSVVGDSAGKWWCGVVIFPHTKGLNSLSLLLEKFREEMKKFVSLLYQIINIYLRTLVYRNLGQWVSCVRVSRRRMQGSKSSCVS